MRVLLVIGGAILFVAAGAISYGAGERHLLESLDPTTSKHGEVEMTITIDSIQSAQLPMVRYDDGYLQAAFDVSEAQGQLVALVPFDVLRVMEENSRELRVGARAIFDAIVSGQFSQGTATKQTSNVSVAQV